MFRRFASQTKKRSIILLAISVKLFSANITQLFEGLYR